MKIVIEGSPEEIERILRKLAPRERRTQLAPRTPPFHLEPIVGPQIVDPVITYPPVGIPTWPYGTITTGGLTIGDCVSPLTVGSMSQH